VARQEQTLAAVRARRHSDLVAADQDQGAAFVVNTLAANSASLQGQNLEGGEIQSLSRVSQRISLQSSLLPPVDGANALVPHWISPDSLHTRNVDRVHGTRRGTKTSMSNHHSNQWNIF